MEATIGQVLFFALVGSVFSLVGGIVLISREKFAKALANLAMPFAAGALLATAFLDLLPEALEMGEAKVVFSFVIVGILSFFVLERILRVFHHHHAKEDCEDCETQPISLIVVGDTLHNFIDGVAIAGAFLVSFPVGVITTLAVAVHEIPQEIGDFGLLLAMGMKRGRVLLVNFLSALATLVGAVLAYYIGGANNLPLAPVLALTAGFFIYISASDIIPSIHHHAKKRIALGETALIILGILVVVWSIASVQNMLG